MAFRYEERLRDTVPGTVFLTQVLHWGLEQLDLEGACEGAMRAVADYLYGPVELEEIRGESAKISDNDEIQVRDKLEELDREIAVSDFIHGGNPSPFLPPEFPLLSPDNPKYHPRAAFWTATPLSVDEDTWTICGENLNRNRERMVVDVDRTRARIHRVDSLRDWKRVTTEWNLEDGAHHWASVAREFDAIALGIRGLLLAHPGDIWDPSVPSADAIEALREKSLYLGVGAFSAVSMAWLNEPPSMTLTPVTDARSSGSELGTDG